MPANLKAGFYRSIDNMELQNLNELAQRLQSRYLSNFKADDILLPENFKKIVRGNGEYTFLYKKYMVHMNSTSLNGYIPNSWFVIASYFVEYYDELQKYKKLLLESLEKAGIKGKTEKDDILSRFPKLWDSKVKQLDKKDKSSEAISKCQNEAASEISKEIKSILERTSLSDNNKDLLNHFVSDYRWWYGGKGLERNDFYVSPILTLAKVVNASHSYIAELCKFLSEQKTAAALLRHPKAIVVDTSLPSFFINVFKYLYANENSLVDLFAHLTPGQSKSVRYAFDFNGIRQTNFFIKGEDNFKAARKGDFNEYPFIYEGEKYYLSQELTKQREAKNEVSFYGLKQVIESLYPQYELIEESDIYIFNCNVTMKENCNLQQIFYGAPGTGKSHTVNEQTEGKSVIRTTFHPDSDYSTFVGAYKPTMELLPICDETGQPMKIGSTVLHKKQITYKFVEQAFLQAYVKAWKFFEADPENPKKQYLIIEEINRGNCAQIFGDLFQLLDRNEDGFSSYDIKPDSDIQCFLSEQKFNVKDVYDSTGETDISEKINRGELMSLPPNLYIWATMNTSDQSLFPIDSAFKRRWDWEYVPIEKGVDKETGKAYDWKIEVNGHKYDWWEFLEAINKVIYNTTKSEDKQLGFFFCKANADGIIDEKKFVNKVIFYLWNDVFKDYGFNKKFFEDHEDKDNDKLTFDKFFKSESSKKVEMFLLNLELNTIDAKNQQDSITTSSVSDENTD